jgi:hypothetical protein
MLAPDETVRLANVYSALRDKLLDLTKRNRMLSYSLGARSRRSLQIVDAIPNAVYRALVDQDASLALKALDEPKDIPADEKSEDFLEALDHARNTDIAYLTQIRALESTGRDDEFAVAAAELELRIQVRVSLGMPPRPTLKEINRNDHARSLGINPNMELPASASDKAKRVRGLQTLKFPDELEGTLELIAGDARLAEQEMGLSTLFLSFGFLEWYGSDASDVKSFAPLLLLPVRLERQKVSGKWNYSISSVADTVEVNLSLQKFLELEFGRRLPEIETLDEEQSTSIDDYLSRVANAIDGFARWKVHRWLVLGHFSFGRLAMYADLASENWKQAPINHRLLKVILQGAEDEYDTTSLSLAKFVPPDGLEFDLLVIDEASQMRPEDAFGAFLRCKQVVVVGDAKQLPPTEFFNRANEDESSWDDAEDDNDNTTESILESCHKSFGQVRQLKWHYRSRCESLIAFSNGEFYNNSLVTFPTARPGSFSVSLLRVDGVYQGRRNIAEASRIAEEAISFMRAFAQRPEGEARSLGIVALIKIPHYQRFGTNQIEKTRYLESICGIVRRISSEAMVKLGETEETEFKSTLRVNMTTRQKDPKMEFTALRAIASLLNSNGGRLIIGVADNGEALGLEIDGFENEDKMSIHLNNLIHTRIGSQHSVHIRVRFEDFDGARIMAVSCSAARLPVFF